jgi:N-dimethylarginine dimethylaminohydrolase
MTAAGTPHFLMCPPEHFGVSYTINPWMDPESWARQHRTLVPASRREWTALHRTLVELGASIEVAHAAPGVPDLVFTANSAVVLDRKALLARFRHAERQLEEPHIETVFRSLQARGVIDAVQILPDGVVLEGAGDCVWDPARNQFWVGYGQRSDAAARSNIEAFYGVETIALELADPRFYHLDTALCPLSRGDLMYVASAFTGQGQAMIRDRVAPEQRIEIGDDDACRLAANAICIGDTIITAACSEILHERLEEHGYRVVVTPLEAFRRSGGAAFCLTLRLDHRSAALSAAARATRVA